MEVGKLESGSRKFDLRCAGKCQITNGDLKLITSGFEKIPDLFAIGDDGNVVYAQPTPMGTIQMPKGRNGWVRVELKTISSKFADAEKYLCLGIRRRGKNEYLAKLYKENLSKYIGMASEDVVELVPLISTTALPGQYTEAAAGTVVNIAGTEKTFDFSSVYRVETTYFEFACMKKECDLFKINGNGEWHNNGQIGIGPIKGKSNQLVVVNKNGQLACSSDGLNWEDAGNVCDSGKGESWQITNSFGMAGPVRGKDRWCVVNNTGKVRYLIDGAEAWVASKQQISVNVFSLAYGNGLFIATADNGHVHMSNDAEYWENTEINNCSKPRVLGCGTNMWLCGGHAGALFTLEDRKWIPIDSSDLSSFIKNYVHGGYYGDGFFYVIEYNGDVIRSTNGKEWNNVANFNCIGHINIVLFNGALFSINNEGNHCHIGFPYPNGEGIEVI